MVVVVVLEEVMVREEVAMVRVEGEVEGRVVVEVEEVQAEEERVEVQGLEEQDQGELVGKVAHLALVHLALYQVLQVAELVQEG